MLKSFYNAFAGIKHCYINERNFKIHTIFAILALLIGFYLELKLTSICLVLLAIGIVISAEMFNTAVERIMDFVYKEKHEDIKIIKDIAAGAVLVSSIVAAIIGFMIFLPPLLSKLGVM